MQRKERQKKLEEERNRIAKQEKLFQNDMEALKAASDK